MTTAVLLVIAGLVLLVVWLWLIQFVSLWLQGSFSGANVSLAALIGMRLRKVDPRVIVFNRIRAVKSGLDISPEMLETHYLSGGRVQKVVTAMILAKKGGMSLGWDIATAIDLAGRDIIEAVESGAKPRAFLCGQGNPPVIEVQAADGTLLRVTVEVTCRTEVNRLVGGETLETLQQRICDAVGDFVAGTRDAHALVASPAIIERHLSDDDLDADAAIAVTRYRVQVRRVGP